MTNDAQLNVDDKEALEFLERMVIKHKVVRDLLEKMFMVEDQYGESAIHESNDAYGSGAIKH